MNRRSISSHVPRLGDAASLGIAALFALSTAFLFTVQPARAQGFDPAANGMSVLWNDEFNDSSTVDLSDSLGSGYKWYLKRFYGVPDSSSSFMNYNTPGTITFTGCNENTWGYTVESAAPDPNNGQNVIGTMFKDTAPMYIEWRCRTTNPVTDNSAGWPQIWCTGVAGELDNWTYSGATVLGQNANMPGNSGVVESIENDLMELQAWGSPPYDAIDQSNMHDWLDNGGNYAYTINGPFNSAVDFTQFHTYGVLLQPATAANSWQGSKTFYFDGTNYGTINWTGNQDYTQGFPTSYSQMEYNNYIFSQLDNEWEGIIMGTDDYGNFPLQVDYIRVWGTDPLGVANIDASGNVTYGWNGSGSNNTDYVSNGGFENGSLSPWNTWSGGLTSSGVTDSAGYTEANDQYGYGHSGNWRGVEYSASPYDVDVYQIPTGLPSGTYTLTAWVWAWGSRKMGRSPSGR